MSTRVTRSQYDLMNKDDKLAFMAGGRVTVAELSRIVDGKFVAEFCPKIRGFLVGDPNNYRFPDKLAAQIEGKRILAGWIKEFYSKLNLGG